MKILVRMKKTETKKAFTLIELIVGVGVIGILASAGVAIFARSLRGTSQVEIRRTLDSRAGVILNGLSRFMREGSVVSLETALGVVQTRSDCLTAGQVNGDELIVKALDGLSTTFSVNAGMISSASASTVVLNPDSVTLAHQSGLGYYFTWYCNNGIPDRLVMQFKATAAGQQGDTSVNSDYILDVTMRNSGQ